MSENHSKPPAAHEEHEPPREEDPPCSESQEEAEDLEATPLLRTASVPALSAPHPAQETWRPLPLEASPPKSAPPTGGAEDSGSALATIEAGGPVFAPTLEDTQLYEAFEETLSPFSSPQSKAEPPPQGHPPDASPRVASTMLGVAPAAPRPLPKNTSPASVGVHTPPASARYLLGEELGRGAVGRVLVAHDPVLGREVALKMLIPQMEAQEEARARFLGEARVTAGLGHPNIVPVFDLGRFGEGTFYFTMQKVRGRPLSAVIHDTDPNAPRFGRYRLLGIVHQVCQAVAFAHTKGVLHRDLKPQNVMVGDFGEVYLMDWGLAKIIQDSELGSWWSEGQLIADVYGTQVGQVRGTPAYMAPEQAQGLVEAIDERTDIFGLGAILYEVLTHQAPIDETEVRAALIRAARGDFLPPRERAPELDIPPELEEICLRAMARDPKDRYAAAIEMAEDLELYLEGAKTLERKHAEAMALVRQGEAEMEQLPGLEAEAAEAAQRIAELRRNIQPYDPIEKKRLLWQAEEQLREIRLLSDLSLWRAVDYFHQAFALDPSLSAMGERLASFSFQRYLAAQERGQVSEMRVFETFTRRFAPHLAPSWFAGEIEVEIKTSPPGAEVFYARYEEVDRHLVRGPEQRLGTAPLCARLPWGSGVLLVRLMGYGEVVYPIYVRANRPLEVMLSLFPPEQIGEGFVHIPAGNFFFGGDPDAGGIEAREELFLDDFFLAKRQVTCGEYAAFLNAVALRSPQQAAQHAPRMRAGEAPFWTPGPDGRYSLPCRDFDGTIWEKDWPVSWISLADAESYAAYRSARDQVRYRLASEEEWEKAARGTDGRIYPWGNHFDPVFCRMVESVAGNPLPVAVGSYLLDCSPYGVRDLGGNVADLTTSYYSAQDERRVVRGGAYCWSAESCRTTWRGSADPHKANGPWGFRLVKDPAP